MVLRQRAPCTNKKGQQRRTWQDKGEVRGQHKRQPYLQKEERFEV